MDAWSSCALVYSSIPLILSCLSHMLISLGVDTHRYSHHSKLCLTLTLHHVFSSLLLVFVFVLVLKNLTCVDRQIKTPINTIRITDQLPF